jgi:serine/threonine-protein phosphatase 2B catalytic subunit
VLLLPLLLLLLPSHTLTVTHTIITLYNYTEQGTEIKRTDAPTLQTLTPEKLAVSFRAQQSLTMGQALFLIDGAIKLLEKEPNVLQLHAPVRIVGDLHGQFFDLLSMLEQCGGGQPSSSSSSADSSADDSTGYLFLGDYVDRGAFSCEVLLYLLALKLARPGAVHLVRGNHECRALTAHFGFKDECKAKYGLTVYYRFLKCFERMPLCAVVSSQQGRYFCCHGGISPELEYVEQINSLERASEPAMSGALVDLLWADPVDDPSSCLPAKDMSSADVEELLAATYAPNTLRGCR